MANVKNYTEQGGEKTVIGGEINVITGGALKIANAVVTSSAAELNKLTGMTATTAQINAGVALVGAMVGGYGEAEHDTDTSTTKVEVLAANASGGGSRAIMLVVKCTQTFAAVTNKPIFKFGDGTVDDAFGTVGHGESAPFDTMTAGDILTFAGVLLEERPIEIDVTDGTGTGEAGAIEVFAIALPA